MGREIGAHRIGVPYIEQARRHPFQPKRVDQMLRRIESHVAKMDLIVATLIEKARNQRTDFPGAEHKHAIHDGALYSSVAV